MFLLLVILWAGHKGYWVYGGFYREAKRRGDDFERLLLQTTQTARKAAGKVVERVRPADELEAYGDDEIA